MNPSPDYILEIGSQPIHDPQQEADGAARAGSSLTGRPWLAVYWRCCHHYSRIYRNAEGTAYAGRCPSCGRRASAKVGAGGVSGRFFTAE